MEVAQERAFDKFLLGHYISVISEITNYEGIANFSHRLICGRQ
jgi:hypothetical protein